MTKISIFGGTGYAGGHIVEVAAVNGHDVTCITRHEAAEQIAGVRYLIGSIESTADRARELELAEVVIVAISPRGSMAGRVRSAIASLASEAAVAGVRLGVIGGAGSLLQAEGGALVMNGPKFPDEIKLEAAEMSGVLDDLRSGAVSLDWFYVSPAVEFGPGAAGEYTGDYRVGDDRVLTDSAGRSEISGADFAVAVVEEIEDPAHRRARFTVAY